MYPQKFSASLNTLPRIFRVVPLAISLFSFTASAQIIVPTLVGSQNLNTDTSIGATTADMTNSSGLSTPVNAGATLASAQAVTHVHGGGGIPWSSWVTNSSGNYLGTNPAPVFVWDLGRNTNLANIVLWQYGNDGGGVDFDGNSLRTFTLSFSQDATGPVFTGPAQTFTMNRVWNVIAATGANSAQSFPLNGVVARYVQMTLTTNYFGQPGVLRGGDRVGLGELRFDGTPLDDAFQVRYASNLTSADSVINITNTGANGASPNGPGFGSPAGNICVNVYAFSPDEQLVACCSCLVTPNGLVSLSVNNDLVSNTLTGVRPNSVVVKLLNTLAGPNATGTSCTNSAALAGSTNFPLSPGLLAFHTTAHAAAGGGIAITETPFSKATLSPAEQASVTNRCTNIIGNGSTFGICRSCRAGGLVAAH